MSGKTSTASKRLYNEKAYDRISLVVKKGRREELKAYAESKGMSINGYINKLIDEDMKRRCKKTALKESRFPTFREISTLFYAKSQK